MRSELEAVERALHARTGLACAAAQAAGLPGRFRVWERAGLLAVLATEPELGFLSTVSGVTTTTLPEVVDLVNAPDWQGGSPTVVLPAELTDAAQPLRAAGFEPTGERILAVRRLAAVAPADEPGVVVADDRFTDVLVTGYQATGMVAAFIRADHQHPAMHRFLLLADGEPIAAAGLTMDGEVAVIGGASTLPAHRGQGAQSRLLRHRLAIAATAGHTLAVATAQADSVSAANLARAGFTPHRRTTWTKRQG